MLEGIVATIVEKIILYIEKIGVKILPHLTYKRKGSSSNKIRILLQNKGPQFIHCPNLNISKCHWKLLGLVKQYNQTCSEGKM